jgi:hypothetical protein
MEAEAQPLLERLGLEKDDPPPIASPAPAVSYSGTALGLDLHIVCNGEPVHQMLCNVTVLRRALDHAAYRCWCHHVQNDLHFIRHPKHASQLMRQGRTGHQLQANAASTTWTRSAPCRRRSQPTSHCR